MSENLSNANSSRKGLYCDSESDVLFDANAIGCRHLTVLPPGSVVVIRWDRTPAKASALPSIVRMKGVPSYRGAERTGSETSLAFSARNVLVCSAVHLSPSLYPFMMHWSACFF